MSLWEGHADVSGYVHTGRAEAPFGPPCDGPPPSGASQEGPRGEGRKGPSRKGASSPCYIQPRNDMRMPKAMIPRIMARTLTFFLKSQ